VGSPACFVTGLRLAIHNHVQNCWTWGMRRIGLLCETYFVDSGSHADKLPALRKRHDMHSGRRLLVYPTSRSSSGKSKQQLSLSNLSMERHSAQGQRPSKTEANILSSGGQ
jgi:hypothetical protein